jgi:hypothetical protein
VPKATFDFHALDSGGGVSSPIAWSVMTPRPGRVAQVFDMPVAPSRTVAARAPVEFGRLCLAIDEALLARSPAPLA